MLRILSSWGVQDAECSRRKRDDYDLGHDAAVYMCVCCVLENADGPCVGLEAAADDLDPTVPRHCPEISFDHSFVVYAQVSFSLARSVDLARYS